MAKIDEVLSEVQGLDKSFTQFTATVDGKFFAFEFRVSSIEDWKKWTSRFLATVIGTGIAGILFGLIRAKG